MCLRGDWPPRRPRRQKADRRRGHRSSTRSYADNFPAEPADPILLAAWDRPHLVTPNFDDALVDPSRVFHGPREVAEHPLLTEREKREVLQRWLWDARLIETAVAEGMPDGGEPSRLDEVLDALARLDASAARPQAAADSAPRLRVPPDALRRSHSSSPMSFRDAVGKPTASQPAVGGLGTEKERFGGPWMSRSESGHDGAYRQRPDLSQDGEVPSRFASFRRRLRHGLRSPMLRAFRQIGAAANAVVGAVRMLLSRWAERWRAWREERRSLAELARLDDRCLEDIGLRRIRTSAGGEVIVPILDDSWTATARSAANDNARSDGTKVPTRRAA
jgi:uncharacterized protein YjiS (DUF1127 family)